MKLYSQDYHSYFCQKENIFLNYSAVKTKENAKYIDTFTK